MSKVIDCDGPYVCPYPSFEHERYSEKWTCPGCGATYKFKSQPGAWHGKWSWTFWSRLKFILQGR